jgi:hypothetical protein
MKTLPALALTVALAAFLLLPVPFELVSSLLFAGGFGAIAVNDYRRRPRSVALRVPAAGATRRNERFGLAA